MHRFSSLLFVIVIATPLFAQSIPVFNEQETTDLITIATYCANVEDYSNSQVPRIFAQIISVYGQSAEWVEFDSRAAWSRAGSPKPVALVWYRDAKVVRVKISPKKDDESPGVYSDYCYRQDGTLARLGSVPSERQKCEPSRYQCTLALREVRFYPPEGPVLKTYGGVDAVLDVVGGTTGFSTGFVEALPAERVIQKFVPMNWPEYPHVTDLPFRNLLSHHAIRETSP